MNIVESPRSCYGRMGRRTCTTHFGGLWSISVARTRPIQQCDARYAATPTTPFSSIFSNSLSPWSAASVHMGVSRPWPWRVGVSFSLASHLSSLLRPLSFPFHILAPLSFLRSIPARGASQRHANGGRSKQRNPLTHIHRRLPIYAHLNPVVRNPRLDSVVRAVFVTPVFV